LKSLKAWLPLKYDKRKGQIEVEEKAS
jgi:hypothetical protein